MNKILKNILAVIFGWLLGSVVNMGLIMISGLIIPPPEGADMTIPEGMAAAMHLLEAKHFLFPFLAHALGTLFGAFVASKIAGTYKKVFALVIGGLFFIGGVMVSFMVPAPTWFIITDLLVSYIPMAWLGWKLAGGK